MSVGTVTAVPSGSRPPGEEEAATGTLRPPAGKVVRGEAAAVFAVFAVLYSLLGYWVVVDLHVVDFEAFERAARALMVWHDEPAKLAAIDFAQPPLTGLVLVPFALFRDAVTSGVALPLSSALPAAGALALLLATLALRGVGRVPRLVAVALVAANPLLLFAAVSGSADALYLLLTAFALYCLVGWGTDGSPRYLLGGGVAFALAAMARYELILWAFGVAFVIALVLEARRRPRDEVEASVLAHLAPLLYALGLWTLLNALILDDPLAWLAIPGDATPVNSIAVPEAAFDPLAALGESLRIQLVFPATLIAVPLLLRRGAGPIGAGLALLIMLSIAYTWLGAAIEGAADAIALRDALAPMLVAVAGFAWMHPRTGPAGRSLVIGLIALAALALPAAWWQMRTYPHQNLEQAFTRAVESGDDQEGTASRGGLRVGVAAERQMASFIEAQELPDGAVLTDSSRTFGVIALSGRPELFLDPVDSGEERWRELVEQPLGAAALVLVERSPEDRILRRYPSAVEGGSPELEPVAANDRYALLRVVSP